MPLSPSASLTQIADLTMEKSDKGQGQKLEPQNDDKDIEKGSYMLRNGELQSADSLFSATDPRYQKDLLFTAQHAEVAQS